MNKQKSIVFLGASGAVGGVALSGLADHPDVSKLTLLVRREIPALGMSLGRATTQHIVDTTDPATYATHLEGHDTAVCTIGVGEPSKVSREEFTRIDHDAVLAFARACRNAGLKHFVLLGSVGANANSRSFYLKSKGSLRETIAALGFESAITFQPSMIVTPTNRYGLSQAILLAVWPAVSTLLWGPLKKYRGIPIETLGRAIANAALSNANGARVMHWEEIRELGRG
jgi:uncharacterized protein YbjT (DUF2867 family)